MTLKRHPRVIFAVALALTFFIGVVLLWPQVTEVEKLTGHSFELSEVAFIDDTGVRGEGHRIWIYRIPDEAVQRLVSIDDHLDGLPMWSALAFDGYKQLRWTDSQLSENAELSLLLKSVGIAERCDEVEFDDVHTIDDARNYAQSLTWRDGTLISGWYTLREARFVTNYFVYVINLEERVLVKLSLLT